MVSMAFRARLQKIDLLPSNVAAKPIAILTQFAMKAHRILALLLMLSTQKAKLLAH